MNGKSIVGLTDYLTRQRLLDSASEGSQSPERTSRSSLIAIPRRKRDICKEWIPIAITLVFLCIASACILFLVFSFAKLREEQFECETKETDPYSTLLSEDRERLDEISQRLQKTFDAARIRKNLRWLSKNAHIAGTQENSVLMMKIADEYHRLGFQVKIHNYSVLLNYPDFEQPNTIEVRDEEGKWWIVSEGRGRPLGPPEAQKEQSDHRSQFWWNAYSPNGTVEGRLVYCNYGMREDFEKLEDWGERVEGAIVLIRYGGVPRADKVKEAERRGAVGVVLFSDPQHYTGIDRNRTFPDDVYLPGEDAQRGTTFASHGDPLTPLFPSLNYVHRSESVESATVKGYLPRIPVTPIGYLEASYLFANMDGPAITDVHWRGALNIAYRRTGSRNFRLRVRSRNARRTITNVIAKFHGKEEPDQWVLVGNHVDAWGTGAIDPLSGTATQLEMARVVSKHFSIDPPRRTLVFCHWDAEEYGLIGSTEWVEEMQFALGSRAVAYINVDHIAGNTTLDIKATPSLFRLLADSAERIPQPNKIERKAGRRTLLDSWRFHRGKGPIPGDRTIPDIGYPQGGSDYQRFVNFLGVPSADLKMESSVGQSYALYHTMYETFWTVQKLVDPHFSSMSAVGQLWLEVAHRLANELIIPLNSLHVAQSLSSMMQRADTHMVYANISKYFPAYRDKMDRLRESVRRLHLTARALQLEIQDISSGDSPVTITRLSQINSRLAQMERVFVDPLAFPSSLNRHLLFSPARHPSSQVPFLPLLLDPLNDFLESENPSDLMALNDGFTRIQYAIESAIILLSF